MAVDKGPKVLVSLWAMMGFSLIFMALRFFSKRYSRKSFGLDDYVLACSWVFAAIYSSLMTKAVKLGLGKHANELPLAQIPETLKFIWIGNIFIVVAVLTSKSSFAITQLRIAEKRWHRGLIWFILVTMHLIMCLFIILILAQCSPISMSWSPSRKNHCWPQRIQTISAVFAGAYSTVMDFLLATCPWLMIHKLQINRKEKVGVICVMSLGFLAGITSIVKTMYLPEIAHWSDITYQFSDVVIWTVAEIAVTIIAASMPFFRPLVKAAYKHTSNRSYANSYRLESISKHKTSRNRNQLNTESIGRRFDDSSDKSILGESGRNQNAIFQSREIVVEYTESNNGLERREAK